MGSKGIFYKKYPWSPKANYRIDERLPMDDNDILLAHMDDLARKAAREGSACSRFLTPAQQAAISRAFTRRNDVTLRFAGGFAEAERRVAVLLEPSWGACADADVLCAIELAFRRQDSLGHRDILGALMALGIERATLGDIEAQNPAFLVCTPPVGRYICENLTQAGRVGIKVRQVELNALPARTVNLREVQDTVASLRLDALVAAAFNLSRADAAEHIRMGHVQLEHQECLEVARVVSEAETFSLRGEGKARLLEIGGQSRKGRLWVTIGRYV